MDPPLVEPVAVVLPVAVVVPEVLPVFPVQVPVVDASVPGPPAVPAEEPVLVPVVFAKVALVAVEASKLFCWLA